MYLSSLYGPVYLVSHTVKMYMMPESGLIIALEPSRKSGFQMMKTNLMTTAVHVTMGFLPTKIIFKVSPSVKTDDDCVSDVQLEENNLSSALPLIYLLKSYPTFALIFVVLYFPLCCVWFSTFHLQNMAYWAGGSLFQPFCPVFVLFSWIVVMRLLHCVVLECLWNSWCTTEEYRL